MTEDVKPRRGYDSSRRQEQAQMNRDAALDAAQRQFLAHGYAGTSVAAIAREAGVSVPTIYKVFGGKAGLVRAIYDRGLLGAGPRAAYERSDAMRERESDPRVIFRNWGHLTTEVAGEVSPIRLLLRSAALADPELEQLLTQVDDERLARMRHHADFLHERGYLRSGVSVQQATDVLWTCSSVELYDLLVVQRGWSPAQFAGFVTEFMTSSLLAPGGDAELPDRGAD